MLDHAGVISYEEHSARAESRGPSRARSSARSSVTRKTFLFGSSRWSRNSRCRWLEALSASNAAAASTNTAWPRSNGPRRRTRRGKGVQKQHRDQMSNGFMKLQRTCSLNTRAASLVGLYHWSRMRCRVDEMPSRMMRRKMHLAAGELQVDSALPAYPEILRSTIQISTAPADRSSAT